MFIRENGNDGRTKSSSNSMDDSPPWSFAYRFSDPIHSAPVLLLLLLANGGDSLDQHNHDDSSSLETTSCAHTHTKRIIIIAPLLLLLQDINQGTSQMDHIRDYYSSDGSRVAGWSVVTNCYGKSCWASGSLLRHIIMFRPLLPNHHHSSFFVVVVVVFAHVHKVCVDVFWFALGF